MPNRPRRPIKDLSQVEVEHLVAPSRSAMRAIGQLDQWVEFIRISQQTARRLIVQNYELPHRRDLSWLAPTAWDPFKSALAAFAYRDPRWALVEASGWLPHHTTPLDEISSSPPKQSVRAILDSHYSEQWPSVRMAFDRTVTNCQVDDEAKAAFVEALNCHQQGNYRAACRTVFPEIERVLRAEFSPGNPKKGGLNFALRKAVKDLPARSLGALSNPNWHLLERFNDHLYREVGDDTELLERLAHDPLPNRHACMHGLVSYRTDQNSFNALAMTEFVFAMITQVRAEAAPDESS